MWIFQNIGDIRAYGNTWEAMVWFQLKLLHKFLNWGKASSRYTFQGRVLERRKKNWLFLVHYGAPIELLEYDKTNHIKMKHFSEFRFIQYIKTFDRCQILTILTAVIMTFRHLQKLAVYRLNHKFEFRSDRPAIWQNIGIFSLPNL